jgi:hypothetical protein
MDPNFIEVNEIDSIHKFLMSIDWKNEWWLIAVGCFHIVISACAVFVSLNFQIVIFFSLRKFNKCLIYSNLNIN